MHLPKKQEPKIKPQTKETVPDPETPIKDVEKPAGIEDEINQEYQEKVR